MAPLPSLFVAYTVRSLIGCLRSIPTLAVLLRGGVLRGFSLLALLDACLVACVDEKPAQDFLSIDEVRASRAQLNATVISKLKESIHAADLMASVVEDVEEGMMTAPIPLSQVDLKSVSLARRLVGCERGGG